MTLDEAKLLIGQKVCVGEVCGILEYLGPNSVMGWDIQATVNRMPIEIKNLKEIKIAER